MPQEGKTLAATLLKFGRGHQEGRRLEQLAPSGEAKGARFWGLAAEWGVTCTEATEKISPGFSPKYMAGKQETTGQS